jgi:RNA polymerase sigma-70 factor (ECF subfamily)
MRPQIRNAPRRGDPGGSDPPSALATDGVYGMAPAGGASPDEMIGTATRPLPSVRGDAMDIAPDAAARFTQVYEAHLDRLTAFAGLLTAGDSTAAEDLAHEVFVDLLQRLNDDPTYLREPSWPWLRTAVTHLASKRHRAALRELQRFIRVYEAPQDPDPWSHLTVDFAGAIAAMPLRMRACVVLTYVEDQSAQQVAETLGCKARTVETQLRRARKRLKDSLGIEARPQRPSPPLQERP